MVNYRVKDIMENFVDAGRTCLKASKISYNPKSVFLRCRAQNTLCYNFYVYFDFIYDPNKHLKGWTITFYNLPASFAALQLYSDKHANVS